MADKEIVPNFLGVNVGSSGEGLPCVIPLLVSTPGNLNKSFKEFFSDLVQSESDIKSLNVIHSGVASSSNYFSIPISFVLRECMAPYALFERVKHNLDAPSKMATITLAKGEFKEKDLDLLNLAFQHLDQSLLSKNKLEGVSQAHAVGQEKEREFENQAHQLNTIPPNFEHSTKSITPAKMSSADQAQLTLGQNSLSLPQSFNSTPDSDKKDNTGNAIKIVDHGELGESQIYLPHPENVYGLQNEISSPLSLSQDGALLVFEDNPQKCAQHVHNLHIDSNCIPTDPSGFQEEKAGCGAVNKIQEAYLHHRDLRLTNGYHDNPLNPVDIKSSSTFKQISNNEKHFLQHPEVDLTHNDSSMISESIIKPAACPKDILNKELVELEKTTNPNNSLANSLAQLVPQEDISQSTERVHNTEVSLSRPSEDNLEDSSKVSIQSAQDSINPTSHKGDHLICCKQGSTNNKSEIEIEQDSRKLNVKDYNYNGKRQLAAEKILDGKIGKGPHYGIKDSDKLKHIDGFDQNTPYQYHREHVMSEYSLLVTATSGGDIGISKDIVAGVVATDAEANAPARLVLSNQAPKTNPPEGRDLAVDVLDKNSLLEGSSKEGRTIQEGYSRDRSSFNLRKELTSISSPQLKDVTDKKGLENQERGGTILLERHSILEDFTSKDVDNIAKVIPNNEQRATHEKIQTFEGNSKENRGQKQYLDGSEDYPRESSVGESFLHEGGTNFVEEKDRIHFVGSQDVKVHSEKSHNFFSGELVQNQFSLHEAFNEAEGLGQPSKQGLNEIGEIKEELFAEQSIISVVSSQPASNKHRIGKSALAQIIAGSAGDKIIKPTELLSNGTAAQMLEESVATKAKPPIGDSSSGVQELTNKMVSKVPCEEELLSAETAVGYVNKMDKLPKQESSELIRPFHTSSSETSGQVTYGGNVVTATSGGDIGISKDIVAGVVATDAEANAPARLVLSNQAPKTNPPEGRELVSHEIFPYPWEKGLFQTKGLNVPSHLMNKQLSISNPLQQLTPSTMEHNKDLHLELFPQSGNNELHGFIQEKTSFVEKGLPLDQRVLSFAHADSSHTDTMNTKADTFSQSPVPSILKAFSFSFKDTEILLQATQQLPSKLPLTMASSEQTLIKDLTLVDYISRICVTNGSHCFEKIDSASNLLQNGSFTSHVLPHGSAPTINNERASSDSVFRASDISLPQIETKVPDKVFHTISSGRYMIESPFSPKAELLNPIEHNEKNYLSSRQDLPVRQTLPSKSWLNGLKESFTMQATMPTEPKNADGIISAQQTFEMASKWKTEYQDFTDVKQRQIPRWKGGEATCDKKELITTSEQIRTIDSLNRKLKEELITQNSFHESVLLSATSSSVTSDLKISNHPSQFYSKWFKIVDESIKDISVQLIQKSSTLITANVKIENGPLLRIDCYAQADGVFVQVKLIHGDERWFIWALGELSRSLSEKGIILENGDTASNMHLMGNSRRWTQEDLSQSKWNKNSIYRDNNSIPIKAVTSQKGSLSVAIDRWERWA